VNVSVSLSAHAYKPALCHELFLVIRLVVFVQFTALPVPQVTLQDHVEVAGEDSEAITAFLENKVEYMIQKANSQAVGGRDTMLPLIRLRVSFANLNLL